MITFSRDISIWFRVFFSLGTSQRNAYCDSAKKGGGGETVQNQEHSRTMQGHYSRSEVCRFPERQRILSGPAGPTHCSAIKPFVPGSLQKPGALIVCHKKWDGASLYLPKPPINFANRNISPGNPPFPTLPFVNPARPRIITFPSPGPGKNRFVIGRNALERKLWEFLLRWKVIQFNATISGLDVNPDFRGGKRVH